ncbi:response regulator receiver domain [Photobacterium ganghwense]|uniref:response regulator receiver domain n=1 Tax=Photobacterium ganghwense TaxID=320778 RepID=UPI001A8FCF1A|nr:response regulator receiver domain [Photobacterium ganghwense]QSV15857.1 hypothetical protein FH974_21630 [Photobacterium ganghwense]
MANEENFKTSSLIVATSYLQTVLAVDDQLGFGQINNFPDDEIPSDDMDSSASDPGDGFGNQDATDNTPPKVEFSHYLDYQMLANSFSEMGLICSGLKPDFSDDYDKCIYNIYKTAKNADLAILDWEMEKQKDGSAARAVINELAKSDCKEGGRLRLVVIYTGVPEVHFNKDIVDVLANNLKDSIAQFDDFSINVKLNEIDLVKNGNSCGWRVVVLSKNSIEPDKLPERVVNEFVELTSGMLSNSALTCVAEIRDKTHNLLFKYNKKLDFAFISHVLGVMSLPESRPNTHNVAFDYTVDLISEEIRAILQTSEKLKDSISERNLTEWPKHINSGNDDKFKINFGNDNKELDNDELSELLALNSHHNYDQTLTDLGITPSKFKKGAISLRLGEEQDNFMMNLSSLEQTRRNVKLYNSQLPVSLKQGTVVECGNDLYVCVQPLCDSLRLKVETDFIFIKSTYEDGSKKFNSVIESDNGFLKMLFVPNFIVKSFSFYPDKGRGEVLSEFIENNHFFTSSAYHCHEGVPEVMKFKWLGELKSSVSQSLSNSVASQLLRVGLDTNEWLRLHSR